MREQHPTVRTPGILQPPTDIDMSNTKRWSRVCAVVLISGVLLVCCTLISQRADDVLANSAERSSRKGWIRFQTVDEIEGADIYANGVLIGQTPCEITAQDLISLIPDILALREQTLAKSTPADTFGLSDKRFHLPKHTDFGRHNWVRLDPVNELPEAYREHENIGGATALYDKINVHVDLNGMKGYSRWNSAHVSTEENGLTVVTLDPWFDQWQTELGQLLDLARMHDYQPPEEWYTAYNSYGERGWRRLTARVQESTTQTSQNWEIAWQRRVYQVSDT